MGADGHIVICRREAFERATGIKPSDIGLYTGTMLGVEACWGYYGEPDYEPNYGRQWHISETWDGKTLVDATPEELEARQKATEWFEQHAETHEVWT